MRLIDADKLKSRIQIDDVVPALDAGLKALIDNQETVDVVPVVRCKDCKEYEEFRVGETTYMFCEIFDCVMKPNDFCCYGKKGR